MNCGSILWLKSLICAKTLLLLLFLFFCKDPVLGQPYAYKFNYLTVDEGLSHTDANDIAQDKKGYIWIATYFGLNRYDGYTVRKYYNNNYPLNNAFKNRLRCLYPDDEGKIWLGTEDGLQYFDPRTEKYTDLQEAKIAKHYFEKIYKPAGTFLYGIEGGRLKLFSIKKSTIEEQPLHIPEGTRFSDMATGENGFLYLASNKGVWILDQNKNLSPVHIYGLPNQDLTKISFDLHNNLLITSKKQVFLTTKNAGKYNSADHLHLMITKLYTLADDNDIKGIASDHNANYWVNTSKNLYRLDNNLTLIQVINRKSSLHSLNSNSLSKILIDRSQCLWVCAFGGGVNFCDLNPKLFYTLQHNPENPNSLSDNYVRSILEDGNDLWIGTMAGGLNRYNLTTQKFIHYNTVNSPVRLKNNVITALAFDNDHNLWIGSDAGIEVLKKGGKEIWKPKGYENFPTYVIEAIAKDYYGNMWFGNHTDKPGVIWKDKNRNFHVKYYDEGYFFLANKKTPELLVSSTHGLKRFVIDAEGNIKKTYSYNASTAPNTLSSDYVYPIAQQNDSTYWVGTIGGGLNRLSISADNKYSVQRFDGNHGVFNDVESLELDNAERVWMGGNGLVCLDPATRKLTRYDKNDGLQGNSFKVGSSAKGKDGKLYFGGIKGLNYFNPEEIKINNIEARPIFTDLFINNQRVVQAGQGSVANGINQAIGYSDVLKFNYLQNNFVLFFSAMHFANPLKCRYRFKLIGFDKDWKYTDGNNPSAAYSNLDYREYRFVVEATNNDGIWSKTRAEINVLVMPPWWESGIAKFIYLLLTLSILAGIYIYQARWYRLKREIEVRAIHEKKVEEMHRQREELYKQQLLFFTNVSHEFRTPLTLILGPLESLISQNKNTRLDYSYQLMFKNAKRLMNLISELMNFKKVSDSIIKLQVQPLSINQFCKDVAWEFQELAQSKGIHLKIAPRTDNDLQGPHTGYFDVQILEKILFNLLNNSLKYTNSGGEVSFEIFFDMNQFKPSFDTGFQILNKEHRAKEYIYFRVADTGIGISSDSITRIFDRYYRISKNHLGSGVGLALVKSLTQLHKGDIYVYSERYKGTEIIIGIPWGEENYQPSEKVTSGAGLDKQLEAIDNTILLPLPERNMNSKLTGSKSQKHILIVEDNSELRTFLKEAFEPDFFIYEAEDGNAAVEIAKRNMPDLIISDLMMPGMNGIELCKLLKNEFETSHIPFIILSAKDALDTKIEGMESGADFYFTKPLSLNLLLLTVKNIFDQREKLKLRYTQDYLADATELVHSEKDKDFLQQLLDLIEDHMQNPDLDVDFLCKHLHLSRTILYQKLKKISDQSVGEFIRTTRLKKAIQIMTHEGIPMNEVVDRIGMQSSSNFSRAFKKEYGKSPLQFMQSLKKC